MNNKKVEIKKVYWVIVEPSEPTKEKPAWFFLTKDGKCEYKNTLNESCSWDYIPTKEEIASILDSMNYLYDRNYYVIEPYFINGKTKDFNVNVIVKETIIVNENTIESSSEIYK